MTFKSEWQGFAWRKPLSCVPATSFPEPSSRGRCIVAKQAAALREGEREDGGELCGGTIPTCCFHSHLKLVRGGVREGERNAAEAAQQGWNDQAGGYVKTA